MNINKLMKQAQEMQAGMQKAQEELANQTVEASVAGGKVTVVATGAGEVTDIKIDPSIVDADDVEFLQEIVLKGVQEAITKGKEMATSEMSKLTGGLNIPGLG
jgi:DNA-binding YbaB/EbfC family protein